MSEVQPDPAGRQLVAFRGDITTYWSYTLVRDYLLLMPDLNHTALRLYMLLRSMVIEDMKHLSNQGKRRLTIDQLCFLLPGPKGKPTSVSTLYQLLKELEVLDLVVPSDTLEAAGASKLKGKEKAARGILRGFTVNELPSDAYTGWRNIWDKLAAYRDDWRENPAAPPTHLTTLDEAGRHQIHQVWAGDPDASDPFQDSGTTDEDSQNHDPFQDSGEPFQDSGTGFQDSGKDPALTSENAPYKEASEGSLPPPPAAPVPPQRTNQGGGGGDAAPQQDEQHTRAANFVDQLDYDGQLPNPTQRTRLAHHVATALAQGWSEDKLRSQIHPGSRPVDSKLAIYLHRLKPENLPDAPRTAPAPQPRTNTARCYQCTTSRPIAVTWQGHTYCASCAEECSSCGQLTPESAIDAGRCHQCRTQTQHA